MTALAETSSRATQGRPTGAVALVTGAARGIGAAVAAELAADGWSIALLHRGGGNAAEALADKIADAGGRALAIRADLRDRTACDDAFDAAGQLGPVLCVVNNAGMRADNLALSISDEEWDSVLDTNLTAAFRLTRCALRPMLRARFGRVVNIASVVGPRANPGQANYAASKAGLIGMTKTVAAEVARKGVTVNAVAPGFIATDMTADLPAEVVEAVPARRAGTPREVAACVRFLASDAAAYVTGTTLYVDGGMSA
ncbi:MAG: 3-oxoacyl-[acyl-carrier protein] reductase [Thermoleophilaceae bacterium]|jgi:3-oxoacyl-[acyl-carrier protein] reductase|nr:3-oxoacyl-[acyl-carrier protein] reductase [Thermoleophilaceae bacterium]